MPNSEVRSVDVSSIGEIKPNTVLSSRPITVDAPHGEGDCIDVNFVKQPTGLTYDTMENGEWVKKQATRVVAIPCKSASQK